MGMKRNRHIQVFESEHISFVKIAESLLGDYLDMINDFENVGRFIGDRKEPFTEEQELEWVHEKVRDDGPYFSMIEKKTGDFIGNIEFMDIHDDTGELGIAITVSKQDKGFGKEAIRAMTGYGSNVLGLKRMVLKAYPDNSRAIHVYEECGFIEYDRNEKDVFMEYAGQGEAE